MKPLMLVTYHLERRQRLLYLVCRDADGQRHVVRVTAFPLYFLWCLPRARRVRAEDVDSDLRKMGVRDIQSVTLLADRQSIFTHCVDALDVFRVDVSSEYLYLPEDVQKCPALYEYNGIDAGMRYLIDRAIVPCGWIDSDTLTTLSGDCSRAPVDPQLADTVAPLLTLYFDIECVDRRGCFPDAENGEVVCIGCVLVSGTVEIERRVFVSRTCDDIDGCKIVVCADERALFERFAYYVHERDPDVLAGYNIIGFDLPHLFHRAQRLSVRTFDELMSGIRDAPCDVREKTTQSAAKGKRRTYAVRIPGRQILDVYESIRNDVSKKYGSYTLNSVAQEELGETKDDVHHSVIATLWDRDSASRRRLCAYCLKDALLPFRISVKNMLEVRFVEMVRVTGVTIRTLLELGQQERIISQLLRFARDCNYVVPIGQNVTGMHVEGKFEGATVLEPVVGFYPPNKPVMTLDFASLYPSIMIANNLSYDTFVPPERRSKYRPDEMAMSPAGHTFLTGSPGILSRMLRVLLDKRAQAKKDMKVAASPQRAAVMDSRQLALKVSANSIYGFTGVPIECGAKLRCVEISTSVTSYGRLAIDTVKRDVETTYAPCTVIYGDTDSVFVRDPTCDNVADAWQKMIVMAADITKRLFSAPMSLAPEKVFGGLLLEAAKRYIGLRYTTPDCSKSEIYFTGMEVARRDYCQHTIRTLTEASNFIFVKRDIPAAVAVAKRAVEDLYLHRVGLQDLLLTRCMSREADEYTNDQAHVVLVEKMRARDPSLTIHVGDRIAHIMTDQGTGKVSEMAEDPLFMLANGIQPSTRYYVDHQLRPPLERLFHHVIGDRQTAELFSGEHTRHRVQSTGTVKTGIMAFVTRQRKCVVCTNGVALPSRTVCKTCAADPDRTRVDDVRTSLQERYDTERLAYDTVYQSCQKCQGSDEPVTCMARDCSQLYVRTAARTKCEKLLADIEDLVK